MKRFKFLSILFLAFGIVACNNDPSLQQYYVDNQGNKDFVALDLPASMLANIEALDEDQKQTLATVKKVNFLAVPLKPENMSRIEEEKNNVNEILKDEKYQLLMKFGMGQTKIELYYTGEEEAVDEVIIYGFDDNRGMGIARVLGEKMNPGDILNLLKSMEKGDVDLSGISGVSEMFTGLDQ